MNIKCSVCSSEIDDKYCSTCGQYFKSERITSISILKDLFGNIFSLEKSFFKNFKLLFFQPKKLVTNYWNGYRGFYYSPSRFLTIAALFTLFDSIFTDDFFGIEVTSIVVPQLTVLIINIILLTFFSFVVYFRFKKTFYEHLILNMYTVSLWAMLFVPISMLLNLLDIDKFEIFFFLPFHLLIMIWNSKSFEMSKLNRFIYIALNFILLYGIIFLLVYLNR